MVGPVNEMKNNFVKKCNAVSTDLILLYTYK